MEWIEARALKSSFLSEIAMLSAQQVCFDDVRDMANVTCDDFSVDDLLDFSDKDFEDGLFQGSEEDEAKDSFSTSSSHQTSFDDTTSFVQNNDFEPVPVDEMENLEWLSQFVDDSGTGLSLLCPVGSFCENRPEPDTQSAVQRRESPCFPLPVSRRPRGKRSRPIGRLVWTLGSSSSMTAESSSMSSSSSSTNSPFMFADQVQENDSPFSVEKPPAKKQKNKPDGETGSGRRCSHCQVQKTPQWRTGPLGPKTLCNACGVRYKSGRLFPEYRPACSPTFSQELHSSSHRKVLEMRRTKEMVQ